VSLTAQLPALQVIVPLLTAPLVMLLRAPGLSWAAATAASVMSFAIAVALTAEVLSGGSISYAMGNWPGPYGIVIHIGAFGSMVLLLVTGASAVALVSGRESLGSEVPADRRHLFYAAWLIVLAGLAGITVTGDAFNVFVFMEISSLASYILIAAGPDRRALTATFKYLIMGTIGATFYLIGVGLVYMMTGTLNFADMEVRIAEVTDQRPILVAAGFITVGLALKAAVFPLHIWLPNAYTFAPHIVTAFFAACSTKVAIYVLLRFDFLVFQANLSEHVNQFASFLLPLSLLGIMVGSAVAVLENSLKRLLAWSSVAQIGYILLGAGLSTHAGLTASVTHMFNHALAKGALFLALAGMAMHVDKLLFKDIGGIGRRMPWTTAALVIAGASLVGIPGTAGFVSKWLLLQAAFQEGTFGMLAVVVVVLSSLAAAYYIWRIVEQAYFGKPVEGATAGEAPWPLLAGLWLVAIANIYFGLAPQLPVTLAETAATNLLGLAPQ